MKSPEELYLRVLELEGVLRGLTDSIEYHNYVVEPKPEWAYDEYDQMMADRWWDVKEALGDKADY